MPDSWPWTFHPTSAADQDDSDDDGGDDEDDASALQIEINDARAYATLPLPLCWGSADWTVSSNVAASQLRVSLPATCPRLPPTLPLPLPLPGATNDAKKLPTARMASIYIFTNIYISGKNLLMYWQSADTVESV